MQAYTYSIRHLPTNKIYYGVRKSATYDLGTKYFSSSKLVKALIKAEPIENFEFKLRKKFTSYEEARAFETAFLIRIKAVSNPMVFNQSISSPRVCSKDYVSELKRRESISNAMKLLWTNPEYSLNQSFNKLTSEEYSKRGTSGALKRAENYATGKTQRKAKRPTIYKDVVITRNGILKTVKANQVHAYVKSGYSRV